MPNSIVKYLEAYINERAFGLGATKCFVKNGSRIGLILTQLGSSTVLEQLLPYIKSRYDSLQKTQTLKI